MKTFVLIVALILHISAFGQDVYLDKINYHGWEIKKGDTVSLTDYGGSIGEYQYVFKGDNLLSYEDNDVFRVKGIKKSSEDSRYYVHISGNEAKGYYIDLDGAVSSGEISIPKNVNLGDVSDPNKSITGINGVIYKVGDYIKLGTGSMPDGDFKYIRINAASLFRYYSNTGYNGLANQANSMPRASSGMKFKIIRIDRRGTKENGYVYYPIIKAGARYEIDLNNALKSGEVAGYSASKSETISTADELKKFKDLRDSGAITEDEYQQQKQKLLSK